MADADYTNEKWLPVAGFEGHYMISDYGRVWSVKRSIIRSDGRTSTVGGRVLKCGTGKSGHKYVTLAHPDSGCRSYLVHRMVLETFVGPCPPNMECCHYDDNPGNNRLPNLRWASRSENMLDRTRNGIDNNGTKNATHCARGHEFDDANTITYRAGHRSCRACKNDAERRRRDRRRAERQTGQRAANPRPVRTHCKRGHLLEHPNLRTGQLPSKNCKACHRAQSWASYNKQTHNLQAISDDYYARMMVDHAAKPRT